MTRCCKLPLKALKISYNKRRFPTRTHTSLPKNSFCCLSWECVPLAAVKWMGRFSVHQPGFSGVWAWIWRQLRGYLGTLRRHGRSDVIKAHPQRWWSSSAETELQICFLNKVNIYYYYVLCVCVVKKTLHIGFGGLIQPAPVLTSVSILFFLFISKCNMTLTLDVTT